MRNSILMLSFLFLTIAGCKEEPQEEQQPQINDAAAYNDSIIKEQLAINERIRELNDHLAELDSASIAESYAELKEQTRESIQYVENMPAYKEDARLKSAANDLFNFYKDIFNNEYENVITILYKGQDSITREDKFVIDSISTAIEHQEAIYIEEFQQAHQAFARDHNLILKEEQD